MPVGDVVGVVGLGNIGLRVARHLAETGVSVLGHDVDRDQAAHSGVPCAATLSELAASVDAIVLSLPGPPAIHQVVHGEGGLVAACRPGQTVIDLSTTDPEASRAHARALGERHVAFLDAGISGGPWLAETGQLTLMIGADDDVLAGARWLLERIGSKLHHMGGVGAGHTMKLVNNFLNGVSLAAAAEAMVVCKQAGLDLHQALAVINQSSGSSWATTNRFPKILDGDYLEGGLTSALMAKDLVLYLDLVTGLRAPTLAGPPCLSAFRLAQALGYGSVVSNHVVDALNQMADGTPFLDHGAEAP